MFDVYRLQSLLSDYERVLADIPACLMALLMPYKQRMEQAIKPGLTTHSWLSVGVSDCMSFALQSLSVFNNTVYVPKSIQLMN